MVFDASPVTVAVIERPVEDRHADFEVARLVQEQAALRRVAAFVASGASPGAVLETVAAEAAQVLDADGAIVLRYEPDATATVVADRREYDQSAMLAVGTRLGLEGRAVTAEVLRTGRPARMDSRDGTTGVVADCWRRAGLTLTVAAPIVVEGRIWGVIGVHWTREDPPADGVEARLARFTELLDAAIASADSRAQLAASRARVLAAGDDARRRVVRDLHDGAQQRMVHTIVTLKLAMRALERHEMAAGTLVAEALDQAEQANADLRELAQGMLPSVLTRGGLRAGVDALVSRIDLPVRVDVTGGRLPPVIEASAYFVVSEALTNVIKHARARQALVRAAVDDGTLRIEVSDDGVGGANRGGGGLLGLDDRIAALGGKLCVHSAPGDGTRILATLPLTV